MLPVARDCFEQLLLHRGFKSQISNVHVQDETIDGPDGNRLPLRIYTPAGSQDKAHPVLVSSPASYAITANAGLRLV